MKYMWSAPEVIQVSQMDCGPSCLKSVLQGFKIPVHFGRLREACQTDVDGTSVDTIEELAYELGLNAQQVLVPLNQLSLPAAKTTPAILITLLPNNLTHFIVIWRSLGPWVQIMDPTHGRHWITWGKLKRQVYLHKMNLSKDVWEAWANGDEYREVLTQRLSKLSVSANEIETLFSASIQPKDNDEEAAPAQWLTISCLDAATTWTEDLQKAGALKKGHEVLHFLNAQYTKAITAHEPWKNCIPHQYWWATPNDDTKDLLNIEAAVLVKIDGVADKNETEDSTEKTVGNNRLYEPETSIYASLKRYFYRNTIHYVIG